MYPDPKPAHAGKCQCITFNRRGYVTESDNALFNTGRFMGRPLTDKIPFINTIFYRISQLTFNDAPLFFPRVQLDMDGYSGVCDLMFTRERRAEGDVFVWFIYDHTLHYGPAAAKGPKRRPPVTRISSRQSAITLPR